MIIKNIYGKIIYESKNRTMKETIESANLKNASLKNASLENANQ